MNYEELLEVARSAREYAYAPYSNFRVGAALLASSGKVYTGCNVENISFGATICAERAAVCKAVSNGERDFDAIAVYAGEKLTTPCGICLQTLSEFCRELDIVLCENGKFAVYKLSKLMPMCEIPIE